MLIKKKLFKVNKKLTSVVMERSRTLSMCPTPKFHLSPRYHNKIKTLEGFEFLIKPKSQLSPFFYLFPFMSVKFQHIFLAFLPALSFSPCGCRLSGKKLFSWRSYISIYFWYRINSGETKLMLSTSLIRVMIHWLVI